MNSAGSRAAREAELEALRQKQLAGNQAKNLSASGTHLWNMDDWQAKQRALKEQDRQNKEAATKGLHSFKGPHLDQRNSLTSMKAEDREKKKEAWESLHKYKNLQADMYGKPKDGTRKGQMIGCDDANPAATEGAGGDVASMIESYISADSSQQPFSSSMVPPPSDKPDATDDEFCVVPPAENVLEEPPVMIERPAEQEPILIAENQPLSESGELVGTPPAAEMKDIEFAAPQTADDVGAKSIPASEPSITLTQPAATTAPAPATDEAEMAKPDGATDGAVSTEKPKDAGWISVNEPSPVTPVPETVSFSFALLSSDYTPNVNKYMIATQQILNTTEVAVVKDVEQDVSFTPSETTQDKKRYLVRASIASFDTAPHVLNILRNAISDGSFLSTAMKV